jgi:amidase/aspartyl-tRNA(Asn)/glutamyl-tRNA(Gln) amidotransferase subunit A
VPAAFCGLFGFRLTPGHPWIADAFPLSTHFDTAGWFTTTADDLLAVNAALLGLGTSRRALNGCYLECGELDADVAAACRRAAEKLCAPADTVTRAGLLHAFAGATESYAVQTSLDAAAAHAGWLDSHRARYTPKVWERIDLGRHRSAEECTQAAIKRATVRAIWTSYFLTFDYLVMPAVPCPALARAQWDQAHRERLLELTTPASLGGLPVLTLPVALASGLTAGLQVIVNNPRSPVIPWALERWRGK